MSLGFLFPGQGSQHIGMGKFLWENFPRVKQLFEQASDTISLNFKTLCFFGPEESLTLTENTQPALLLISSCYDQVLQCELGITPQLGAGHSLGEYSALVSSKSILFEDALRTVRFRGEAMQQAVATGKGSMVAVMGPTNEQVEQICKHVTESSGFSPLEPANYNCPGQVVVSGSAEACQWLLDNFKAEELKISGRCRFISLKVSAPFHCSLMKPAEEAMGRVLGDLNIATPRFEVFQNYSARSYSSPDDIRLQLKKQVTGAVKWTQSIESMANQNMKTAIEIGPGKVISGLIKKINPEIKVTNIQSLEDLKEVELKWKTH